MRITRLLVLALAISACGARGSVEEAYDLALVRWFGVGSVTAYRLDRLEAQRVTGHPGATEKLGKAADDLGRMKLHYREAHWDLTPGERRFADAWNDYVRLSVDGARVIQRTRTLSTHDLVSIDNARERVLDVARQDDDARDLLARVNRAYPRGLLAQP